MKNGEEVFSKKAKSAKTEAEEKEERFLNVDGKGAKDIEVKTKELLEDWVPFIRTITSDNGKEFANHERIAEDLGIDFYFARPYHSWERGANENLNGLVRQYFPKGTNFDNIE